MRQGRVDVDLRRRTLERNAFSCRRISGCCAASTDETHIPGGAPTLVTFWAVNACTASAAACRWLNPLLALALSCAACGGSPTVLMAFRTEQQAQEHWRYRFGAALNLRSAPIGTTVSRGTALPPGPGGLASRASADVPAHVLPDRFATMPSMAVRKLFSK